MQKNKREFVEAALNVVQFFPSSSSIVLQIQVANKCYIEMKYKKKKEINKIWF